MSRKEAVAPGLAGMVMGLLALVAVFVVAVAESDPRDDHEANREASYNLDAG